MLTEWIKNEPDSIPTLPFCHTTRWGDVEAIIKADLISKKFSKFPEFQCDNGNSENMIYMFYGLPYYMYKVGVNNKLNIKDTEEIPVGFLFNSNILEKIDRCFPFDTGAFCSGMLEEVFNIEKNELDLFRAEVSGGSEISKIISRYYKNNESYCYGFARRDGKCCDAKEEKLINLIHYSGPSDFDFRYQAIEAHCLEDIKLSDYVLAVLLPEVRSKNYPKIVEQVKKIIKCNVIYYRDFKRFNLDIARQSMIEAVLHFYNKTKSIKFNKNKVIFNVL